MKIFWYIANRTGWDGTYFTHKGYVFADSEDEAKEKVMDEEDSRDVYVEESDFIKLQGLK